MLKIITVNRIPNGRYRAAVVGYSASWHKARARKTTAFRDAQRIAEECRKEGHTTEIRDFTGEK